MKTVRPPAPAKFSFSPGVHAASAIATIARRTRHPRSVRAAAAAPVSVLRLAAAFAAATLAFAAARATAADAPPLPSHGIAPLGPDQGIHAAIENAKTENRAKSKQAEITFGAAWIYDTRGDVPGHRGWGGSASFLFSPPPDPRHPDFRLSMGFELLVFHTNASWQTPSLHHKESLDAGAVNFLVHLGWTTPWQRLELGAQAGFGLAGAYLATREDYHGGGHKNRHNGNVDWAMQIHPRATLRVTDHAHLTLGYRFGFITPVVRTDGFMRHIGSYPTVDIVHQSVELAFTLRF